MLNENRESDRIIDVAIEVGFSNKVSFYRAFKKETGLSPTDYKKKVTINRV